MIPARLGSQRLKQKNLQLFNGLPLIVHAIRKCKSAQCFDEIWVNTESDAIGAYATQENVGYHKRPEALANNIATSEQFVAEFISKHPCSLLFQVHSIAPLLSIKDIRIFVDRMQNSDIDCMLSYEPTQIECAIDGSPVNFSFDKKTNSQDLTPIQRITWSITGWRTKSYIDAIENGMCATYNGKVGFHAVNRLAAHVIKTADDLRIAEALFPLIESL
jgi:CMP-N-acetylneuraminic acid synthetase